MVACGSWAGACWNTTERAVGNEGEVAFSCNLDGIGSDEVGSHMRDFVKDCMDAALT